MGIKRIACSRTTAWQLNFRVGGKSKGKTLQIEMQSNKMENTTEWLWHWIMYAKDGRTLDPGLSRISCSFFEGTWLHSPGLMHLFAYLPPRQTLLHLLYIHLLHLHWLRDCRPASVHLHMSECRLPWPGSECKWLRPGSCQLNWHWTTYFIYTGLPVVQQSIWLNGMLCNNFLRQIVDHRQCLV